VEAHARSLRCSEGQGEGIGMGEERNGRTPTGTVMQ
jgi:hypothetical protein